MWKHSKLRFYILNALWNYRFWLFSEKVYKDHTYEIEEDFSLEDLDVTGKMRPKTSRVHQRRFLGYMYKDRLYLDNPGVKEMVDKETWKAWKSKGFV